MIGSRVGRRSSAAADPRTSTRRLAWLAGATVCLVGASLVASCSGHEATLHHPIRRGAFDALVPLPTTVTQAKGRFLLRDDTAVVIHGAAGARDAATLLRSSLRKSSGLDLPIGTDDVDGSRIVFTRAGATRDLGTDGYTIRITPTEVRIVAAHHDAFVWAVQTIRQLLPPESLEATRQKGTFALPAGRVRDVPRYAWRATMLDVARHFFSVGDVEAFVDEASAYKLNRLHLHLTDDQGWRLAIRSHPELTSIGGRTAVGGGPGGFYTQKEYRSLVAYARARGVTIVPEIDLPGHTNAALASDASLTCDGVAPEAFVGEAVGFSTLCVDKESTYAWVADVIGEVAELTPGKWIHIGGDESHATDPAGYVQFISRAVQVVADHDKIPMGWEEIARGGLSAPVVAQHWKHWLDSPTLLAASRGADIVLSPADTAYLDMKYDASSPLGYEWAGYIDTRRIYDWDPATQVAGLAADRVLGVEAPVWTVVITDRAELQQMTLPRLPALAEVAWSTQPARTWDDFQARIAHHGARWNAAGLRWTADPGIAWPSAGPRS